MKQVDFKLFVFAVVGWRREREGNTEGVIVNVGCVSLWVN